MPRPAGETASTHPTPYPRRHAHTQDASLCTLGCTTSQPRRHGIEINQHNSQGVTRVPVASGVHSGLTYPRGPQSPLITAVAADWGPWYLLTQAQASSSASNSE